MANAVKGGVDRIWETVYGKDTASTENPDKKTPLFEWKTPKGRILTLPKAQEKIMPMDHYIDVDYVLPGCPPAVSTIKTFIGIVHSHHQKAQLLPLKKRFVMNAQGKNPTNTTSQR